MGGGAMLPTSRLCGRDQVQLGCVTHGTAREDAPPSCLWDRFMGRIAEVIINDEPAMSRTIPPTGGGIGCRHRPSRRSNPPCAKGALIAGTWGLAPVGADPLSAKPAAEPPPTSVAPESIPPRPGW